MKTSSLLSLLLTAAFVLQPVAVVAMETDQYNLPPVPLADIGDEVSEYVEDSFRSAVDKLNAEIDNHQACLTGTAAKTVKCGSAETERAKLAYLRSNDAVASAIYKLHGDGSIFITHIGKWLNSHKFNHDPARYKTGYRESIFVAMPIDYMTLSPTVRIDGVEFGTDKLDHFFQQGYKYYKIYNEAIAKELTPLQAAKKAVEWGQKTERTYFGYWVSGVYSNADLYANYVGMKFYQGLTTAIRIGEKERPPMVTLDSGKWKVADDRVLRESLLRPFISDHMNEALNPSAFSFIVFPVVRRVVKKQSCPQWLKAFPALTKSELEATTTSLELWNDEDYGNTKSRKMVTIAEACFSNAAIAD